MTKLYNTMLVLLCCLMVGNASAQCTLSVAATDTLLCNGASATLSSSVVGPSSDLTTTLTAGNNHRGNMFDITATNAVTILSFDAHPISNTTIEIYYRASAYAGFETSAAGWTLIGSAAVTAQPFGVPTPVPVAVNVTIPAGQTYSFYVTSSNTTVSLNYTDGGSEGATYVSDANIAFKQGVGMEYPFTAGTGSVFRPRIWNGIIHYALANATTSYAWSNGATTANTTVTPTANTQYVLAATVTGCPNTLYDTVAIKASSVNVLGGVDTAVCAGEQVTLSANVAAAPLQTTLGGGNNHRGNMFDITATNAVTITGFDAHPMGNTTIEIYYRPGSYVGFESNPAGWTLAGSAAVTAQPMGTLTPVPATLSINIPAGQTYGFYVTSTNTSVSLNYSNGSAVGNVYSSDANIQFKEGAGFEYPFTAGGGINMPRVWNGAIHYSTATGATFVWDNSVTDNTAFAPANTNDYIVTATDVNGCADTDTVNVVVKALPNVLAGNDTAVCQGEQAILSGSGATTYAWSGGVTDAIAFTPSNTLTYTVTGTAANGCSNTAAAEVAVNVLPVVNAGNDEAVCTGESLTLTALGADTYVWNNGVSNGTSFEPTVAGDYTVAGTDANGCVGLDTVTVTINALPTVDAGADVTVCAGADVTLSGAGASTYVWSGGVTDATAFTPGNSGIYAVTGTDANGCLDVDSIEVTVNTVDATTSVSAETITANANGASYVWINCSNNSPIQNETAQSFTAMATGSYAVVVTENGCTDTSACQSIVISSIDVVDGNVFAVYPNPTRHAITINTGNITAEQINLFDINGMVVYNTVPTVTVTTIDMADYPAGIYIVKTYTNGTIQTAKVTKQ